jgi:glucan biosynthesis protein C
MQSRIISGQTDSSSQEPVRLHYLDWLRVLAVVMVFVFHALKPFNIGDWVIMNSETSMAATVFFALLSPWGMPFFFLLAGAGSWFALRRRTAGQYVNERFGRLLLPFIVGSLIFTPIQNYFDWRFWTAKLNVQVSYLQNQLGRWTGPNPSIFSWIGYHLWFLGFLFSFSLIALPLFLWLKHESGQGLISRLARLCERRGAMLLFIVPLLVIQLAIRPFDPQEKSWADFSFYLAFFVLGYLLYADERFMRTIRRDWWLLLAAGVAAILGILAALAFADVTTWFDTPTMPEFYLFWTLVTVAAWSWTVFMLFVGMRFLNFRNKWLEYGQEAVVPFYVLHQPVIVAIAFYVVQWQAGITAKMTTVVLASFLVTVGIYELVIRRVTPLRATFGMKVRPRIPVMQPQEVTPSSGAGTQPSA